jgi:hypothetical protein
MEAKLNVIGRSTSAPGLAEHAGRGHGDGVPITLAPLSQKVAKEVGAATRPPQQSRLGAWLRLTDPEYRAKPISAPDDVGSIVSDIESSLSSIEQTDSEPAELAKRRRRMEQLFTRYRDSVRRPVFPDKALEAYKARRQGQLAPKQSILRYVDKRRKTRTEGRSALNHKTEQLFVESLGVDLKKAKSHWGWKGAGGIEGMHSEAARIVTAGASAAALAIGGPLAKVLLHEVPSLLINPNLSGILRVVSQVEQVFLSKEGVPSVTSNIRSARTLDRILADLRTAHEELKSANRTLAGLPVGTDEGIVNLAVQGVAKAFIKVDLLQAEYTERCQMGKLDTIGKGWGAAVNAIGGVGAGLTFANPVAGLAVQGVAALAQLPAGVHDYKNRQMATLHADAKYPKYMKPGVQYLPRERVGLEHVEASELKKAWKDAPAARLDLVRSIAEHRLSKIVGEKVELSGKLATLEASIGAGPVTKTQRAEKAKLEEKLGRIQEKFDKLVEQFDVFKTIVKTIEDEAKADGATDSEEQSPAVQELMSRIEVDSLIGRCLGDDLYCFLQGVCAALSTPGELASQILQRYAQSFQSLLSLGEGALLHDILGNLHGLPGFDVTAAHDADIGLNAAGAVNFTASTNVVRLNKAENKAYFAAPKQDIEPLLKESKEEQETNAEAEEAAKTLEQLRPWVIKTPGGHVINLTATAACDAHLHSWSARQWRILKRVPAALVATPVGVGYTVATKFKRQDAIGDMQRAVSLIEKHAGKGAAEKRADKQDKQTPGAIRDRFIAALGGDDTAYRIYEQVTNKQNEGMNEETDESSERSSQYQEPIEIPIDGY